MARIESWFECDLKKAVQVQAINGNVFSMDNQGNLVGIKVYDDGEQVTLSGSVTGYCILADGTTVSVAGTREENKAYILMPQSALAVPGTIKIIIKLTDSSVITTLGALIGTVYRSRTDALITPSSQVITDWAAQISAQLQDCEDTANAGLTACQTAAANVAGIVAPAFAAGKANAAGTYVTKDGNLYILPNGHTAGTAWENTSKTQLTVGGELTDLKSALRSVLGTYINELNPEKRVNGKIINSSGQVVDDTTGGYFDMMIPVGNNTCGRLIWTNETQRAHRIYYFDSNEELIDRPTTTNNRLITFPETAVYISFQIGIEDTELQFTFGEEEHEYTPYLIPVDNYAREYVEKVEDVVNAVTEEYVTYNLFDVSTIVEGKRKNDSGVEVSDTDSHYYSQYIPVVGGMAYYFNFSAQMVYEFNSSKSIIRRSVFTPSSGGVFSCPEGTSYIQIQVLNSTDMEHAQIVIGVEDLPYVQYGTKKTAIDDVARNNGIDRITEEYQYHNLLDVSTIAIHKIKNDSNIEVYDLTSSYYRQYIPVVPGQYYFINFGSQRIYEFDSNKTLIQRRVGTTETAYKAYLCPPNVHYIQIQVYDSSYNIQYAQITDGDSALPYEPYGSTTTAIDYVARNMDGSEDNNETYAKSSLLFSTIDFWEPETVDSGYSNPSTAGGRDTRRSDWTATDKYYYYEFLEHYYDTYVGYHADGYRVTKRSLGQDSSLTGHELFEYDFCPLNYKYTVLLSAGMNADETQGIWGLATFIRCLMNKEETNMEIMYNNIRFKVIPIINASGFDTDPLRYNYSDNVNPNFNFNYKDSWARQTATWAYKGEYPDSNIATQILKAWINENSGRADLWLDLHTGRWPSEYPNTKIIDIRTADISMNAAFANVYAPLIKDYYIAKGYITASDNIGGVASMRDNLDYQKIVYAYDVCQIKSIMPEMHIESTGYGTDGMINNSVNGIKCYVGQIRAMVMCYINGSKSSSPIKIDSVEYVRMNYRK